MSVEERMREAVRAACAGSVPPESQALIVHAVTAVATADNRKLLDMLKAKDAEINRLEDAHTSAPASLVALGYRPSFAAAAMQGLLACGLPAHIERAEVAESAVALADALIAALEAKS